jgi:hypothetical protein
MSQITITWKAFGEHGDRVITSVSFNTIDDYDCNSDRLGFCEGVFAQTNTSCGPLWDIIEPRLDPKRTHTALSVGDEVSVDGWVYRCENVGFTLTNPFVGIVR